MIHYELGGYQKNSPFVFANTKAGILQKSVPKLSKGLAKFTLLKWNVNSIAIKPIQMF